MTQKDTSRIHDIAMQTMKTWIEQQIFETTQPPQNAACEDQVQCIVDKAINWRRDYIAALTAARNFHTLADYDNALNAQLSPMASIAQKIFLEKIRRVFVYLHGEAVEQDDFKHTGSTPEGYSNNLLEIMNGQGTFDEWKDLISKLSSPHKDTYIQHIAGWGTPKP